MRMSYRNGSVKTDQYLKNKNLFMERKKLNILWPHTKSRSQTFNLDNACLSNNWEGGEGNKNHHFIN